VAAIRCGGVPRPAEPESARYAVELSTEGYQVLDTRTGTRRADVWASREDAQGACDALNDAVVEASSAA